MDALDGLYIRHLEDVEVVGEHTDQLYSTKKLIQLAEYAQHATPIRPPQNTPSMQHQSDRRFIFGLDLCHEYLSKSVSVQTDMAQSTKEIQPTQRANSVRTIYGRGKTQKTTLETLYSLYPTDNMPRVFNSCHSIKTQGEKVASLKLASERDLLILQYTMILWRRR